MKDKQALIQHITPYLYQHGFHATGVEAIAEQSNITKKTLYRHFGNKDQLILEALNYRHDQMMHALSTYFEAFVPSSRLDVVEIYFNFLQEWLTGENFFGCMFVNACAEFSERDHATHQIAQRHKYEIQQFLQTQMAGFDLSETNLTNQQLAEQVLIFGEGLIVLSQIGMLQPLDLGEKIADFFQVLKGSV